MSYALASSEQGLIPVQDVPLVTIQSSLTLPQARRRGAVAGSSTAVSVVLMLAL